MPSHKKTPAHTPPPYERLLPDTTFINDHKHMYWPIVTVDKERDMGIAVVILPDEDDSRKVRKERASTAAFLCTAANSYEDLLTACTQLVGAMIQLSKEHHREVSFAQTVIAKANA